MKIVPAFHWNWAVALSSSIAEAHHHLLLLLLLLLLPSVQRSCRCSSSGRKKEEGWCLRGERQERRGMGGSEDVAEGKEETPTKEGN